MLKRLHFEDVKNSPKTVPSEVSWFFLVVAQVTLSALKLSGSHRPVEKDTDLGRDVEDMSPRLSRSSGLSTNTSCSLLCQALALDPFCLLMQMTDRSFSLPLLYSTADINSDITLACLALCSSWLLKSGSAWRRFLPSIHLQCSAKAEGP